MGYATRWIRGCGGRGKGGTELLRIAAIVIATVLAAVVFSTFLGGTAVLRDVPVPFFDREVILPFRYVIAPAFGVGVVVTILAGFGLVKSGLAGLSWGAKVSLGTGVLVLLLLVIGALLLPSDVRAAVAAAMADVANWVWALRRFVPSFALFDPFVLLTRQVGLSLSGAASLLDSGEKARRLLTVSLTCVAVICGLAALRSIWTGHPVEFKSRSAGWGTGTSSWQMSRSASLLLAVTILLVAVVGLAGIDRPVTPGAEPKTVKAEPGKPANPAGEARK